jgi:hypothetical protein
VVFARKVIEKRAFTDVGGIGDVLHSSVRETVPGKKVERGTKKPLADFQGTA